MSIISTGKRIKGVQKLDGSGPMVDATGKEIPAELWENNVLPLIWDETKKADEMKNATDKQSPPRKAQHTAQWARTMTKWLVTYSRRGGAKWNIVEFGGKSRAESRGIVDLIAIRKNHRQSGPELKRGDLFEIILIQTKGGSARRPTDEDVERLLKVAKHHKAKAVVLAEWRRGKSPELFQLKRKQWQSVSPEEIFS